jgi:mannose-6-phosphate isomerase-like protein (cupin superfamily)
MKKTKLEEKSYILANKNQCFERRQSSQGCEVNVYVHGDKITCGNFIIPPGKHLGRISAHGSDEIYYVIRGVCKVELPRLNKRVTVKAGSVFYMPAGMIHAPYNDGKEETEVFWTCAPEWP